MRPIRALAALLALSMSLSACAGYRLIRTDEIEWPSYEPREVAVPETCEPLIRRAAERGMAGFTETEAREVAFCQQQMVIRAHEEEAAAKRLEAHAGAANFALHAATVILSAVAVVLAWAF